MKLIVLIVRITMILILLSVLSFFTGITKPIVEEITTQFSITKTSDSINFITLIVYFIVGGICLFMVIRDNKYFDENFDVSFWRKLTASIFRLIGFVAIFFILFSIYMLLK